MVTRSPVRRAAEELLLKRDFCEQAGLVIFFLEAIQPSKRVTHDQ